MTLVSPRWIRASGVAAAAVLLFAGCSGAPAAPPTTDPAPTGAFPVTVEHSLGSTVIEREPQRVVTLGSTEVDVALALGVVPVAIGSFYDFERGVGPWAEDELGDATPTVFSSRQLDLEAVAAAAPDLILDVNASGELADYEKLSRIAPTISLPVGAPPFAAPWRDTTRLVAQALGRADDGERLVRETEGYLTGVAAANPAFAGRTFTYLDLFGAEVYAGGRDSTVVETVGELGLVPPPYVQARGVTESTSPISLELLPQVDADVVLAYAIGTTDEEAVAQIPMLGRLTGRLHFLPDLSLSAPSVLSIPYGVDALVPVLQEATAS